MLVFLAFLISAIVAFASGDARILTFEKSIVTLILGVVFLITTLPIKFRGSRFKPFMLLVIKQLLPLGNINPNLVQRDVIPGSDATANGQQQYTMTSNTKPINAVHPFEAQGPAEENMVNKTPVDATPEPTTANRSMSKVSNTTDLESHKPIRRRSRFNKMIMRQLFGDTSGPLIDKYDWMYFHSERFKFDITFLTLWWGFILFMEFIIRLALVLSPMSLDQVVTYANIAFGIICAVGGVVSIIYLFFRFKGTKAEVDAKLRAEGLVDEEGMMMIEAENEFDM